MLRAEKTRVCGFFENYLTLLQHEYVVYQEWEREFFYNTHGEAHAYLARYFGGIAPRSMSR